MAYQEVASDRPALPEYLGRKDKGTMSKEELRQVVQGALAQSVQFIDTEMSTERAKATEYYLGNPFGNEEEGRSQVILTEVRDAVDGMVPSLLRVFFGSEHTVEFVPTNAATVPQAEQATDYVRYVFEEDNAGFLKTLEVLKDGLVRKIGIFKWAWDTSTSVKSYRMEGLTDDELTLLAEDDDVRLARVEKREEDGPPGPQGQPGQKITVADVDVIRTVKNGRAKIWALPPEEFIYNRQARSLDEAILLGHRTDKTKGELLAMGIKEKDIDEHAGAGHTTDVTLKGNAEEIARRDVAGVGRVSGFGYTTDPDMGTANSKILYTDALMRIDYDGDGVAELRRVCCLGPSYYPVQHYPADDSMGFSVFTPYPEPHTLVGGSVADRTMDVQKINSSLMRGMLDSLSAAIFPRTAYNTQKVNTADIMNTAIGGPIRVQGDVVNALMPIEVPFTGKDAMPILSFMQEVIERRTGRNKGAAGLDADALQSTGKEAVGAVLTGSQEQLEMIARVFAEMTLKPLFKGLYRLLVTHQDQERMIRLRGQWVSVNPESWDADLDVTVNVGLGSTFTEKKVATLMSVAADQHELLTTLGLTNPMVTLPMFRNTRAKILALQGIKDADRYYKPIPDDWQPPPAPPPPPDPATMAMQAEHEMNQLKVVKELAIQQDKITLERENAERDFAFKMQKQADDVVLRKYQIDAQFHGTMTQAELDRAAKQEVQEAELTISMHDQLHDQSLERADQEHTHSMNEREMAAQEQQAQAAQQQPSEGA